mmetsp:Transcript_15978/g.43518  ORF Transcript_15978/g.43518 Transcript_15978/m.43518 type:complete len:241 (+) Transcript_15978:415-1137(+)
MWIQKKTSRTTSPSAPTFTVMASSSPPPSPVRLSPECTTAPGSECSPLVDRFPKNTHSKTAPSLSRSTAEASRSTSPWSTSQPRPSNTVCDDSPKSKTSPFSMAKATFCRLFAVGISATMCPFNTSRQSMKCFAQTSSLKLRNTQFECPRISAATSIPLEEAPRLTSLIRPFVFTSSNVTEAPGAFCRSPPLKQHAKKRTMCTFGGNWDSETRTSSELRPLSPTSSPECVTAFPQAFMLL